MKVDKSLIAITLIVFSLVLISMGIVLQNRLQKAKTSVDFYFIQENLNVL